MNQEAQNKCMICNDPKSNWYYGAVICEACKKFFIRSQNNKFKCYKSGNCLITMSNRTSCQYCRMKKCLDLGMNLNIKSTVLDTSKLIKDISCVVCNDKSSGIHFGVFSCEPCKGFFRRSIEKDLYKKYGCFNKENCLISLKARSCRYCRFKKCVQMGMIKDSARLGRQSNIFKHQIIETKKTSDQITKNKRKLIDHEEQNELYNTKRMKFEDATKPINYENFSPSSSFSKDNSVNSDEYTLILPSIMPTYNYQSNQYFNNDNCNSYCYQYSSNYDPSSFQYPNYANYWSTTCNSNNNYNHDYSTFVDFSFNI